MFEKVVCSVIIENLGINVYLSATAARLFPVSLQGTLLCQGSCQYVTILNLVFVFQSGVCSHRLL